MTDFTDTFTNFPGFSWLCVCLGLAGIACALTAIVVLRRADGRTVAAPPRALALAAFLSGVVAPVALGFIWSQAEFRQALTTVPLLAPQAVGEVMKYTSSVALHAFRLGVIVAAVVLPLAAGALLSSFTRGDGPLTAAAAVALVAAGLFAVGGHFAAKASRAMGVPFDLGSVQARCLGPIFDRLPVSSRAYPFDHRGQFLVIERDRVLLDWKPVLKLEDGRVRAVDKEGGDSRSYLVVPLLDAFKRRVAELRKRARKDTSISAEKISFAAEASVPQRTLAEIFYTAGQAEIGWWLRAVRVADDPGRLYLEHEAPPAILSR